MLGGEADEYRRRLSGHALHLVGVHAPLKIIEERERLRRDRMIGLARWQFDKVHRGIAYDLEISTADEPAASCATRIRGAFDL